MSESNFQPKIIKVQDFDLVEYRPGKFVKIKDGQYLGKVSIDEYLNYRIVKRLGNLREIDVGSVEVSIAIAAIAAFLTSDGLPIFIRLFGFAAFLLSSVGAGILYWYFIIQKVHWANFELDKFRSETLYKRWFRIGLSLIFFWQRKTYQDQLEFAYVSVLGSFALIWVGAFLWIVYSFTTAN